MPEHATSCCISTPIAIAMTGVMPLADDRRLARDNNFTVDFACNARMAGAGLLESLVRELRSAYNSRIIIRDILDVAIRPSHNSRLKKNERQDKGTN